MINNEYLEHKDLQFKEEVAKQRKDYLDNGGLIVNLSIFNSLDNLVLTKNTYDNCLYTKDLYLDFVKSIDEYTILYGDLYSEDYDGTIKENILSDFKEQDIIDNQRLEEENPITLSHNKRHRKLDKECAIDKLVQNYGKPLTKEQFVSFHDLLLKGSSSENKIGLRDNDDKLVGVYRDGVQFIDYLPIDSNLIPEALDIFLDFYNSNINNLENEYDMFVKPIIYHGLLGALQLFKDGNTRYGRLIQNVEMWGLGNLELDNKLDLPILYPTRQYFGFRSGYRELIKDIVKDNNSEVWNNWINYNLNRFQDGLLYNDDYVRSIVRKYK